MIERLKSILLKIREDREKELSKIAPEYKGKEELSKQRTLLVLETPFSTDQKDISIARGKVFTEKEEKRERKRSKTAYQIINGWKNSGPSDELYNRESFCDLLQRGHVLSYHRDLGYKAEPITAEELSKMVSLEAMLHCVHHFDPSLEDVIKNLYLNYTNDLWKFINKDLNIYPPSIFKKKQPLSIFDAVKLFEYLETRALKSTTTRAYSDILLCRTLLCAPLPAKKLFALRPPKKDSKGWSVKLDQASFRVPSSLVDLWKGFSIKDRLLPIEFDEDQLSKKIRRLGKYADLSSKLNPSILRLSLEPILLSELGIVSTMIQHLPSR